MLPRIIFTIFTVVFLTYTWHEATLAKSTETASSSQLYETYLDISGIY